MNSQHQQSLNRYRYIFGRSIQALILCCVLSLFQQTPSAYAAPVSQDKLAATIRQDIEKILRGSNVAERIITDASQKMSRIVYAVPQKIIDDILSDWIHLTLKRVILMRLDIFKLKRDDINKFLDEQVEVSTKTFKTLSRSGSYYKERSLKMLESARAFRGSLNSRLYQKFRGIQVIELDVPRASPTWDAVSGTIVGNL